MKRLPRFQQDKLRHRCSAYSPGPELNRALIARCVGIAQHRFHSDSERNVAKSLIWLVELRGIEPLTSAVRLLRNLRKTAENLCFRAEKMSQKPSNQAVCDTSAIPRFARFGDKHPTPHLPNSALSPLSLPAWQTPDLRCCSVERELTLGRYQFARTGRPKGALVGRPLD